MSVIVQDGEGKILLLCKGADRFVINRSVPLNDFECLIMSFVIYLLTSLN